MVVKISLSKANYNNYYQAQKPQEFTSLFSLRNEKTIDEKVKTNSFRAPFFIREIQETNRIKNQLTQAYELICQDLTQEAKNIDVDFVKPELEFKRLDKGINACYLTGENKIVINTSKLSSKGNARYNDGCCAVVELSNGKEVPCIDFYMPFYMKSPKDCVYIQGDEKIFSLAATLKHELTHALQEQFLFNADGGLEYLYELYKNKYPIDYAEISFEDFRESLPFCKNHKPNKKIDLNKKIYISYDGLLDKNGDSLKLAYSPKDVAHSIVEYDLQDDEKYYSDVMEIEARLQQAEFFMDYKKYLPNINVDSEVQDYYYLCMMKICQVLLD